MIAFRKTALFGFCLAMPLVLVQGCGTSQQPLELASLRQSGRASFLCMTWSGQPAPLSACPRGPIQSDGALSVADPEHDLYALITQTGTAEVAVVRVTSRYGFASAQVLDVDRSNPGKTPLRVGQQPEDIVTTLGGNASFVGVKELGRPGIFGLPTKCIFEPVASLDEAARDITTWPACSLSSAPGEMTILSDSEIENGAYRASCDGSASPSPPQNDRCFASLADEEARWGRQKLAVALPEEGKLVVLDAQELLSREPGTFRACKVEAELSLKVELPSSIEQNLPPDLKGKGCAGDVMTYGPFPGPFTARPSGFAQDEDTLFVADRDAPVIHRVDLRDPCALRELDPLIATSYNSPERVVTTSRLALSPETHEGNRFLYAIDTLGERAASVMIFDVSDDVSDRTPLVRPDSELMPFESPDRIEFAAAAQDIAFVTADDPPTDQDGTGVFGVQCDPDPNAPTDSLGALARPDTGLVSGAGNVLRGIFAHVLTTDGRVNIVDVEDFDAACRRNIRANPSAQFDFRGCRNDPLEGYYTLDQSLLGNPTVTNEVTCRAVVPHRARARGGRIGDGSRGLIVTDDSLGRTGAPALVALPRLSLAGQGLPMSRRTEEGRKHPILLGVDFLSADGASRDPAMVYVGTTLRVHGGPVNPLEINPNRAEQPSVVLPFVETRAYPSTETVTVAYEGDIDTVHPGGILSVEGSQARLLDFDARFCSSGVQDEGITRQLAELDFGLKGEPLAAFAKSRTDYVQVVSALPDVNDAYWRGAGAACTDGLGFDGCDALFGDVDDQELRGERDLAVVSSTEDVLTLSPRTAYQGDPEKHLEAMRCCFPGPIAYRVRAGKQWIVRGTGSGYQHPITVDEGTDGSRSCVLDCHPLRSKRRGRVFELSSTNCDDADPAADQPCGVGPRTNDDPICAYDASRGAVDPRSVVVGACVHAGLSRRFAIYRGLEPSVRGMTFSFDVNGGFVIDSVGLSTNQNPILPVSIESLPWMNAVGVVDSASRGLLMVDVRAGVVVDQFF